MRKSKGAVLVLVTVIIFVITAVLSTVLMLDVVYSKKEMQFEREMRDTIIQDDTRAGEN